MTYFKCVSGVTGQLFRVIKSNAWGIGEDISAYSHPYFYCGTIENELVILLGKVRHYYYILSPTYGPVYIRHHEVGVRDDR